MGDKGSPQWAYPWNYKYPPGDIPPPAICPPELVSLKLCQSILRLELNFDTDPEKSPSAELKEISKLHPVVGDLLNVAQCVIDVLPVAGQVLKLGKRTGKVLERIEKVEGGATLVQDSRQAKS